MDKANKRLRGRIIVFLIAVVVFIVMAALTLFLATSLFKVSFFTISGDSMQPTFHNKDIVMLKQQGSLKKGSIVFFEQYGPWMYGLDKKESKIKDRTIVKRVAAVPGDTLTFDGTLFTVNGEEVFNIKKKDYTCDKGDSDYTHTLNSNEFFVLGDNAKKSLDSRYVFCDGHKKFLLPKSHIAAYGKILFDF